MKNGEVTDIDETLNMRKCRPADYDLFYFEAANDYTKDRALEMLSESWCIDNA